MVRRYQNTVLTVLATLILQVLISAAAASAQDKLPATGRTLAVNGMEMYKDSYDDMNFTGPYLSTITARTLIVHGDRDQFFPFNIPVEMYRSIPKSFLWIIPNGGHVPIDDPKIPFASTALGFLAGSWDRKP
jgi:pimeloyl-ACP methyl ester carboxylesterase